jgi:hypothetical protein
MDKDRQLRKHKIALLDIQLISGNGILTTQESWDKPVLRKELMKTPQHNLALLEPMRAPQKLLKAQKEDRKEDKAIDKKYLN